MRHMIHAFNEAANEVLCHLDITYQVLGKLDHAANCYKECYKHSAAVQGLQHPEIWNKFESYLQMPREVNIIRTVA